MILFRICKTIKKNFEEELKAFKCSEYWIWIATHFSLLRFLFYWTLRPKRFCIKFVFGSKENFPRVVAVKGMAFESLSCLVILMKIYSYLTFMMCAKILVMKIHNNLVLREAVQPPVLTVKIWRKEKKIFCEQMKLIIIFYGCEFRC